MRACSLTTSLMIAIAAGGCGSSTLGGADASADGGAFCAQAPRVDCSASSSLAGYCTLTLGMQTACGCTPGPTQGCDLVVLVHGTRYTYLQSLGIDTATIYVYDASGALVAQLYWYTGGWKCGAGPADFDPSEAESMLPVVQVDASTGMCPA